MYLTDYHRALAYSRSDILNGGLPYVPYCEKSGYAGFERLRFSMLIYLTFRQIILLDVRARANKTSAIGTDQSSEPVGTGSGPDKSKKVGDIFFGQRARLISQNHRFQMVFSFELCYFSMVAHFDIFHNFDTLYQVISHFDS